MDKITNDMLNSEEKGYSVRLPSEFHNFLKAQAALSGMTKDEYFKKILKIGYENTK